MSSGRPWSYDCQYSAETRARCDLEREERTWVQCVQCVQCVQRVQWVKWVQCVQCMQCMQ